MSAGGANIIAASTAVDHVNTFANESATLNADGIDLGTVTGDSNGIGFVGLPITDFSTFADGLVTLKVYKPVGGDGFEVRKFIFHVEFITPAVLSCTGFEPPMDSGPITVKKNRALPLKAQLFDADGFAVTDLDIVAPPAIQVLFDSGLGGDPVDVTGEALPAGQGTEGNQFEFGVDKWQFNLKTKNYSAAGTYTITMVSGDSTEYTIDPTCTAQFVVVE